MAERRTSQPPRPPRCPSVQKLHGRDRMDDFDEFVRGQSVSLLRTAYLLTGDRGHAEDLLQDVLEKVYVKWRSIRTSPGAYTRRALVHQATNRWRRRGRKPETPLVAADERAGFPDHAEAYATQDTIVRALAVLPARQRA